MKSILNRDSYEAIESLVQQLKIKNEQSSLSKEQVAEKSTEFKNIGNALYADKKYEEAIDNYTKAIEVDPANVPS